MIGKEIKMGKKAIIRVRAVQDQEFENSYWSFDIRRELKEALRKFKRQFKVRFEITEIGKWDSIGSPALRDFPLNVLKQLQKGVSETEVVDDLVKTVNTQMRIPWEVSQRLRKRFCSVLRKKPRGYQLGYLMGWFSEFLSDYLLADLMKKTPEKTEADIIIGFTGKIVVFPEQSTFPLGRAVRGADLGKDAYTVVGICVGLHIKPSQAILHEVGHLFGAEHIEDKSISSVMSQEPNSYRFDKKNEKTVKYFLTKLGGT